MIVKSLEIDCPLYRNKQKVYIHIIDNKFFINGCECMRNSSVCTECCKTSELVAKDLFSAKFSLHEP